MLPRAALAFALCLAAATRLFAQEAAVPAEPVTQDSPEPHLENVRAFARLYGYVRYFHPSDEASAIDWERFAVLGVRSVLDADSGEALQDRIEALFRPIAPTVQIHAETAPAPAPPEVLAPAEADLLEVVAWQHVGVGKGRSPYRSIRLNRETIEPTASQGFGPLTQRLEAATLRGRDIRMSAAVRAEVSGTDNRAHLWVRVDRVGGTMGFFDNMSGRPIRSPDWSRYEIRGTVDADAEYIAFGGFLNGRGKAWFDDFRLESRAPGAAEWVPVTLENAAFGDDEPGMEPSGWSAPVQGYRLVVVDDDAHEGPHSLLAESVDGVRMAEALFEARPEPGERVQRPLGRGLVAHVPLALYSRDGRTLRPEGAPEPSLLQARLDAISPYLTAEDEAVRYASVVIAWNVFQHFYPYFDVVEADWESVLMESLRRAREDRGPRDFLLTLSWLVAQLQDGHGAVVHALNSSYAGLPLQFDRIEGEVVITAVAEGAVDTCYRVGDVVTAVDGVPIDEVVRESRQYISGSPQWKAYRALQREFAHGPIDTSVRLDLERGGNDLACDVHRTHRGALVEPRPAPIEEVGAGIYYVDLTRADMPSIDAAAQRLAAARGVVFDLRGYPNSNHAVLQHLTDDPLRSAHWQIPQQIYPDQEGPRAYDTGGRWTLEPRAARFEGRIAFLTDGRAISYAESVMGIVEHYGLGEIVGQPTAGANGDVNMLELPDGYRISWTGMRVIKHDGSQHHLVGILPTVSVERTLDGVRAGRDEVLEAALELFR